MRLQGNFSAMRSTAWRHWSGSLPAYSVLTTNTSRSAMRSASPDAAKSSTSPVLLTRSPIV
jgi:hypothetical protein